MKMIIHHDKLIRYNSIYSWNLFFIEYVVAGESWYIRSNLSAILNCGNDMYTVNIVLTNSMVVLLTLTMTVTQFACGNII